MSEPAPASVEVEDPGLLGTIQDLGRAGLGAAGMSPSGAADWFSARAANRLLGNRDDAPLVETTLTGARFVARDDVRIAVTGADAPLSIGGVRRACWRSWPVRAGERIVIGPASRGARSYVAFGGGIGGVPMLFGSASTDVGGGFGGRVLAKGDLLTIARGPDAQEAPFERELPQPFVSDGATVLLRAMPGPHASLVGVEIADALLAGTFRVGSRSSRQALRLEGDLPVRVRHGITDVVSTGVCAGCVQVTGDGHAMVMLSEHQTTGGYPVALCVIWADVARAGQAKPGDVVRFARTDAGGARAALEERAAALRSIRRVDAASAMLESRLARGFFEGASS